MKFKIIETRQKVNEAGGKVAKTAQVAGIAAKGILSGLEGLANLVGMKTGLYDKIKGVVKGFVDFGKQVIDVIWKNRKYSEEEKRIIDAIIKDPTNSDLIHCLSAYGNPLSQTHPIIAIGAILLLSAEFKECHTYIYDLCHLGKSINKGRGILI